MGKCSLLWNGVSPPAVSGVLCPRKTAPHLYSDCNLWYSLAKSNNQIIHPVHMPLSPAKERMFAGSLVLGEAICHLPNVLQEGEHSPLVLSRRSLHQFVCSCVNTLFPGTLARPSFLQKLHTSRTSEFELYMISASKVCDIQYPFFLSLWSKDFFFFLRACKCTLSTPNSLFFPFPQKERASSPDGITNFSLPQFTSIHLPPSMLSPSNYGDPSLSLQISFLNVLSDLTSIHLCSGTRKATGPPSSLPS